jgi:hypothetical protein
MPKPWRWRWRLADQQTALRNARQATAVLEQRRREREEVDAYLQAAESAA